MALKFNIKKFKIKGLKSKSIVSKDSKPKKKFKKKTIIISSIVIIIALFFIIIKVVMPKPSPDIKYTVLSKGNIVNNTNVLGDVKSKSTTNVYTTLNNTVKEVNVKVGDEVKAGDILGVLDSESLQKDIEQASAVAEAGENNAKIELDSRKKAYDNALYVYNNNLNTELVNAEATMNSAKLSLDDKEKIYEYNATLFRYGEISEQELKQKEIDFENAKSDYSKSVIALENAKIKVDEDLNNAKNSYETAQTNYNNNSQKIALEKQKSDLEKCEIKASVDGIITSVNAVVGSPATGCLFQIEDLDNVEIIVSIKEVDIANIKAGQRAEIKTDATGDTVIDGEVVSVDPTAKKSDMPQIQGQSQSASNDVIFEAKVKINELNEDIKVGMNARVNIILDEKNDVYTIPYENIVQNEETKSIFVAEKSGKKENEYIIKELPISIGLESDFNVEISGDGVIDDVIVLNDPSAYEVGQTIEINGR